MAKSESSAALQPEKVDVVLKKGHTHGKRAFKEGDKIKVTPAQRDWLISKGIVAGAAEVANV